MGSLLAVTCLLALQQLHVSPSPTSVGVALQVRATTRAGAPADVEVELQLPDGSRRSLGPTGSDGALTCALEQPGPHALSASVDGVRCVVSVTAAPVRRRWLLGLASVPLGLAFLFVHLRRAKASQ